jgi:hypothetical protein
VASATLIGLAEAAPSPDAQLIAWEAEIHKRDAAINQAKLITDKELDDLCGPIADTYRLLCLSQAVAQQAQRLFR